MNRLDNVLIRATAWLLRWWKPALFALLLVGIFLFLLVRSARSADWASADTARQAIVTSALIVDWAQTRDIARNPGIYETNPLLGKHPSASRVNTYFITAAVLHAAASYVLPRPWRETWQIGTAVAEAIVIGRNEREKGLHPGTAATSVAAGLAGAGIGIYYTKEF